MNNVFLIADTHFGHANILNFDDAASAKIRPYLSVEEMDEALVDNWNRVVKEHDKVYHLGDVTMTHKALSVLNRLHGRKVLIRGNHDTAKLSQYVPYFKDVRSYHVLDRLIFSHIPIHEGSLGRFRGNVHGHLHVNVVLKAAREWLGDTRQVVDARYFSVSVERINFTPIEFSVVTRQFF